MNTEEQILALNRRINKAEEAGHVDELEPLLAENFAVIQSSGAKMSRSDFLEAAARHTIRSRKIEQPEVHFYGNNAVYTCIMTVEQDINGDFSPARYWNMRLFLHQDGQWLCTAWQITKLCAPKYTGQGVFNHRSAAQAG